jgi:hypothetical protein
MFVLYRCQAKEAKSRLAKIARVENYLSLWRQQEKKSAPVATQ